MYGDEQDLKERQEYRDKYKLNDKCISDRFPKFCIWCARNGYKPSVKMNDHEVCFEILSDVKQSYSVCYPIDDFDFYGSDNIQQVVIEEMEKHIE